jgi:hypothetical protein
MSDWTEWMEEKRQATARLAHITEARKVRGLYDALCVIADTLSAFQAQPRYLIEDTAVYNAAGEYLDGLQDRVMADIDALIATARAAVEHPMQPSSRDEFNRLLLQHEARIGQPADEIAVLAATLAVQGDRVKAAVRRGEKQEGGAP